MDIKNPYHQRVLVLPISRFDRRHIEPIFHPIALFRIVLPPVAHTAKTGQNSVTKERKKRYLVARGRRTNQRHLLAVVNLVPVLVVILVRARRIYAQHEIWRDIQLELFYCV